MSMYSRGGESSSISDSCGVGKEITKGWSESYATQHKPPEPGVSQCRGPRGIADLFGAAGEFSLEKGWQCSLEGVQVSSGTECKLRSNVCLCGS